jgi:hypothetical protein
MSERSGKNLLGKKPLDKFISIHVHKCGGTTLGFIFQDIYGDKFLWDKSEDSVFVHGRPIYYNEQHVANADVVHGHIRVDKYEKLKRPYITWLRHPVSRMESEYSIVRQKRITGRSNPLHKEVILEQRDFTWYCDNHKEVFKNYVGDYDVDDFAFIGITEMYEESLCVLSQVIGHEIPPYYRRNTRKLRRQWFKWGTPEEKCYCANLNKGDLAFYHKARKRLLNEFKSCLSVYEPGECAPLRK